MSTSSYQNERIRLSIISIIGGPAFIVLTLWLASLVSSAIEPTGFLILAWPFIYAVAAIWIFCGLVVFVAGLHYSIAILRGRG